MKIIVRNCRLSFNDLFEAKAIKDGKPRFSAVGILSDETVLKFTHPDSGEKVTTPFEKLAEICDRVAKDKWGKVPAKMKNWCFNKADGSTTREEYTNPDGDYWAGFDADTWYITGAKREDKATNGKLPVLDQARQPIEANSGRIFSGCYVNLILDVYAYEGDEGKGVSASLEGVQLLRNGEPLGVTHIKAEDEFEDEEIPEGEGAEDSDAAGML